MSAESQIEALIAKWRKKAEANWRDFTGMAYRDCAEDLEALLAALLRDEAPREIDCPLCGATVQQVASATLSLALWQHVNWTCSKAGTGDEAQSRRLALIKIRTHTLALIKILAHTSYANPTMELLQGLLASIERIADAALQEDVATGIASPPPGSEKEK